MNATKSLTSDVASLSMASALPVAGFANAPLQVRFENSAVATKACGPSITTAMTPTKPRSSGLHPSQSTVSFCPKARVIIIPSHRDMSEDVKASIWRTAEEADAGEIELAKTVRFARRGYLPASAEDDNFCTRGLENLLTPTAIRGLQSRRTVLVEAILAAQDKEWQAGCMYADPETLRNISAVHSKADVDAAIVRGARDDADVRRLRRLAARRTST